MIFKFFHDSRLTWKIIIKNTVNKFFLASDEFMPKMDLKQLWFVNSAYGSFIKNKKQIQKFKETGDLRFIYRNEVNKQCFQNEMPYGNFQDLAKKTASDKVLCRKAFWIASNPNCEEYQKGLSAMVYKYSAKNSKENRIKRQITDAATLNQELADALHKSVIILFQNHKVNSSLYS